MPEQLHYWDFPHGHTIFCDDVRQEVGGKVSFMGVYNGALYIAGQFPQTLPRLGFAITYSEPAKSEPIPVRFRVIYLSSSGASTTLFENTVDRTTAQVQTITADLDDPSRKITFRVGGVMGPILLPEAGSIRARAYRNGEEIRLGVLQVDVIPPATTAQAGQ